MTRDSGGELLHPFGRIDDPSDRRNDGTGEVHVRDHRHYRYPCQCDRRLCGSRWTS
ncbi:hypothetical protein PHAMO_580015 [Magnetospirillum molischianum DSM 120]|uniref:Uncharacterized protein n=1 Tax=Magnetospirillum molischianum DSM 120 TaxID=1150626 RepID=H8FXM1_MAGML|nr:hypothetical protein PHAMO_580015 [Magnetospirillum molischianum DSM 120]